VNKAKVENDINDLMFQRMREYMIVGGMPAVVTKFVDTKNMSLVHAEQEMIIASYLDDIAKYAPAAVKPKARACYLSITKQLAKENNKKFQ